MLANYLTYNRYLHLEKTLLEDPKYETAKGCAALARFINLHPENLAERAEIMIEHFRDMIAHRMKGKAKAMVVCASRPHAVHMWEALRKCINSAGTLNNSTSPKTIEATVIKTIAGFANSRYGRTLLIGVADDGSIHGLEDDYNTFSKRGQVGNHDLWGQQLANLIHHRLGGYVLSLVDWIFPQDQQQRPSPHQR